VRRFRPGRIGVGHAIAARIVGVERPAEQGPAADHRRSEQQRTLFSCPHVPEQRSDGPRLLIQLTVSEFEIFRFHINKEGVS